MSEQKNVLLHIETSGDKFEFKMEGKAGDFMATLVYACRQEPILLKLISGVVDLMNNEDFQKESDAFFRTSGDA